MRKNVFDLPEDRLATTTEKGDRVYLYPAKVRGLFRRLRDYAYGVLIIIFLVLPWVKVGGTPLLLLDIAHRKFIIFGVTFWAHEAPTLVLVFLTFVLTMGLVTALFGRVWCGWACPQTVFIDGVFGRIESLLEGKGLERKRFDERPMSLKKAAIKTLKWGLFLTASLIMTHSFLAYFVGADRVIHMILRSPSENMTSFLVIVFSTTIILFNFGWFREQFCIIACPYGRFQSVFMDENSTVVGYDAKRGEPRRKDRHDAQATGDCINCYRCVQVCPTGIDIRRGTQMECIMCTACIDACNEVMTKVDRPTNLIRLDSENGLKGSKTRFIRPRIGVYVVLLSIVVSSLTYILLHRNMVPVLAKRASSPPYQLIEGQMIQNQFNFVIRNQYFTPVTLSFSLTEEDAQHMDLIQPLQSLDILPGKKGEYPIFLRFPSSLLQDGRHTLRLVKHVAHADKTERVEQEILLVGPK